MKLDIHCHILPGLDDGAKDLDTSVSMARAAVADGREIIVATPHYWPGRFTPDVGAVRSALAGLNTALGAANVPLLVLPGHEVRVSPEVPELVVQGRVLTLADQGKYLLLELPPDEIPVYTEQVCFRLLLQGVVPVIAHPERNAAVCRDQRRLVALVERGCLLQVNAGSLIGKFGRAAMVTARNLLQKVGVHFVASDAHDMRNRGVSLSFAERIVGSRLATPRHGLLAEKAEARPTA